MPLVTGEAGGGGGGPRREDGECRGLGPAGVGRSSPLPSPGPGRGSTLKAKEGIGQRSICCLCPELVSGDGGEPGRCETWKEIWAWGGKRGLQRVRSQGKGREGYVAVSFRILVSLLWGLG